MPLTVVQQMPIDRCDRWPVTMQLAGRIVRILQQMDS